MRSFRNRALGRSDSCMGPMIMLLTALAGIWFVGLVTNIGERIERERVRTPHGDGCLHPHRPGRYRSG